MIVINRRRNERVICRHRGVDLIVNVCNSFAGVAKLGFIGPHEVLREELVLRQVPKPVAHLAGPAVNIGPYRIQRCALCGAILDEWDARNIASTNGAPRARLGEGWFYEFCGNRTLALYQIKRLDFESDSDLPSTCCLIGTQA